MMRKMNLNELRIDSEFQSLARTLTEDERRQLEENILYDGEVIDPLIIWNGIVVDGHNRYSILQKHPELPYTIWEKQFANRYAVMAWICKNQLGRRNLTPQQVKYLIGQRYEAEKQCEAFCGNQYTLLQKSGLGQNDHPAGYHGTRSRIAEETNTSESYVKRADQYRRGVDAAEEARPGIKDELLLGKIKPKETDVIAIAKIPMEERQRQAEMLRLSKPTARVDEPSILRSLECAVEDFLRLCHRMEGLFPRLRSQREYRERLIALLEPIVNYKAELKDLDENA